MTRGPRAKARALLFSVLFRVPVTGAVARGTAFALALTGAVIWSAPVRAENQCTCPKIAADGKGNSSCTVAESNNRCTIDFNVFGERESRAVDALRTLIPGRAIPDANPALTTADALTRAAAAQQLGPTIFVFLMVAAIDQRTAFPQDIPDSAVREIATIFFSPDVSGAVGQAFGLDGARSFMSISDETLRRRYRDGNFPRPIYQRGGVTISSGCISIRGQGGLWVMFKTAWSEARVLPWCTNDRP